MQGAVIGSMETSVLILIFICSIIFFINSNHIIKFSKYTRFEFFIIIFLFQNIFLNIIFIIQLNRYINRIFINFNRLIYFFTIN